MSTEMAEAPSRGMQRYQLESGMGRLTPAERAARGKTARAITQFAAVASGRITAEPDL